MLKTKFRNQSGLSMVEIIMGAGLLAGLSLGLSKLFESGYKNSSNLTQKQEIRDLRDEFNVAIRKNACGLLPPTADGETPITLKERNIKVDVESGEPVLITTLYGRQGQSITAGSKYGKITVADTNPIKITGLARKSPLTEGLPSAAKTSGNYYAMDNYFLGELSIQLSKSKGAGGGNEKISFITMLTIDPISKTLTNCKSLTELSAAKDNCNSMSNEQGKIVFEWDDENFTCVVSITDNSSGDGVYAMTQNGDVPPETYMLNNIP